MFRWFGKNCRLNMFTEYSAVKIKDNQNSTILETNISKLSNWITCPFHKSEVNTLHRGVLFANITVIFQGNT